MWPFKKKAESSSRVSDYQCAYDLLLSFRRPGQTFRFAGVECVVSCVVREYLGCGFSVPKLQGWYKDDRGAVHALLFGIEDLASLHAQNPNSTQLSLDNSPAQAQKASDEIQPSDYMK